MAELIPDDIYEKIFLRLDVRNLVRCKSVCRSWKSLISGSHFVRAQFNHSYNNNENDPHLLVRYNVQHYDAETDGYLSIIDEYVSILDNSTFPQHMSPMTVPLSVKTLKHVNRLGSSCGLICFHGYHKDHSEMVVFWNPSIRKSVSVMLEPPVRRRNGWVGFGVCPETCDPKLVKIDKVRGIPEVHVYTLGTRAWKKVSVESPNELCHLMAREGVCVEGFIYWLERDDRPPPFGNGAYSIVSFDLRNDEFGKVCLPRRLQRSECLMLSKRNRCLIVIDIADADIYEHSLNIWVMKDNGVSKSFAIMFHIEPMFPKYYDVLELTKNGEAIIETRCANNDDADPVLQVYDPSSRRVYDIGIPWSGHDGIEKTASFFSVNSYMETLLLLDQ